MICANCKSDIDKDSFYCDQCGKELCICPNCGKPGKGKNCVEDGGKLFSPKQKSVPNGQSEIQNQNSATNSNNSILDQSVSPPLKIQESIVSDSIQVPVLKIINNHLKIDVEIKSGDIIGRTTGDYVHIFGQFPQISGKHAQFIFDKNNGWSIKDLNSTNGLAINHSPNWQNVPKLKPDKLELLKNNSFLLIANIEFHINIIPSLSTSSSTQRL